MIKELVTDEAILSQKCEPATPEDAPIAQDLIDTATSLDDCSCLAANQIGVTKAMFVYFDDDDYAHVLYNPRILMGVRPQKLVEGCMTREELSTVTRFGKIKVTYDELVDGAFKQRRRDYTGWVAQMIQHMVDHCNGKLV
jgi:peptide deformylase